MDNRTPSLFARLLDEYRRTGRLTGFSGGDGSDDNGGGDGHPPNGENNANPGGNEGEKPTGDNGFTPITSQTDLDRIIGDRLKRDRKSIAKEVRDEIEAEARAAEAKAQGDYKKLLEELTPKHEQLTRDHEAVTGELDALKRYFTTQYDAAMKRLPDALKAFKPADDAPFATKAAYLATAQEQADKLGTQTSRGNGGDPKPGGTPKVNEQDALSRIAARARL